MIELFRVQRSIYGQQILVGANWDLLTWFFYAGAAFIVAHVLYKVFLGKRGLRAAGRLH